MIHLIYDKNNKNQKSSRHLHVLLSEKVKT